MASRFLLMLLFLLSCGVLGSGAVGLPPNFMRGAATAGDDDAALKLMGDAGVTHVRRYALWRYLEPELHTLNASLTVEWLRRNPAEGIYKWAAGLKTWGPLDRQIRGAHAAGITPVVEVGEGTVFGLPKYGTTLADPGTIGIAPYLAYQYRAARAVAQRYKSVVSLFQIENELNEAFLEGFAKQRLITAPWGNWTFLTELLETLRAAIKDEAPAALVTMNFHTDVPVEVHELLHLNGFYVDAVKAWGSLLDIISFDAYPNMYVATPILENHLVDRFRAIKEASGDDKRVFVMETGYPVNAPGGGNTIPSPLVNFSDAQVAAYITASVRALAAAGCDGYFYFKLVAQEGMLPPEGGYTAADVAMFRAVRELLVNNNVTAFLAWLMKPGSIQEAVERAGHFLGAPTKGWGLLGANGDPRPGYQALVRAYSSTPHSSLPAFRLVKGREEWG